MTGNYASLALPLVDEDVVRAKEMQQRLPLCLQELEQLDWSLRLAERKLFLCDKMIGAADVEAKRLQRKIHTITTKLEEDDEEMLLREDERRELQREISILEIEFAEWVSIFGSRCKEKAVIKEGIELMHAAQQRKSKEKTEIKERLQSYRAELPPCLELLRSVKEATHVASALNAASSARSVGGSYSMEDAAMGSMTPAEHVRTQFKRKGWSSLKLEEQQWSVLDQVLNPLKYEWLREHEEEERRTRLALGKGVKRRKTVAAVEAMRFSKVEIEHLLSRPYGTLSRKEALARKLLHKYHDNKGESVASQMIGTNYLADLMRQRHAESAYGFDPHLAERVRAKHFKTFSREEREWASIDIVLHPEVWRFYTHVDVAKELGKPHTAGAVLEGAPTELSSLGRILGMEAGEFAIDGRDLRTVAESTQKVLVLESDRSRPWVCQLDREAILAIWRKPRDQLSSEEERHIYRLLHKYNGVAPANEETAEKVARLPGSTLQFHSKSSTISSDPDVRCHMLMREIDRASSSKLPLLDSQVLHSSNQRFPPDVLRLQLENELDRELAEQIMERERNELQRRAMDSDDEDEDPKGSEDDQGEDSSLSKFSVSGRQERRAMRRRKRGEVSSREKFSAEVLRTTNLLMSRKAVGALALEDAKLIRELGSDSICLACRTRECHWQATADGAACSHRMRELEVEIERVRFDKETKVFSSLVALSAQLGGNTKFRRKDLLTELTGEYADLERRLRLDNIDRELHDAYASRKEYIEVRHLHGYGTMLWTTNARKALEAERTRLLSVTMAKDVIDDILDWMLEGWYFGERESAHNVLGYVPSINPNGIIFAGQDQLKASSAAVSRVGHRVKLKKQGVIMPMTLGGTMREKAQSIEDASQIRRAEQVVAKEGSDHKKILDETESTLRFGLFMLTLMYFRAMTYLSREQKSWAGVGDSPDGGNGKKRQTQERVRMLAENSKAAARKKRLEAIMRRCLVGEQRRKEREDAERKDSLLRLQAAVKRQKLEVEAVGLVQKVYRGHLGRKAVKRWALKKVRRGCNYIPSITCLGGAGRDVRCAKCHRDVYPASLERLVTSQHSLRYPDSV